MILLDMLITQRLIRKYGWWEPDEEQWVWYADKDGNWAYDRPNKKCIISYRYKIDRGWYVDAD